ncbi:MAG: hypothetical protein GX564_00515 [Oligosphaeraceae bacterium]|nr:hypothetical protein [Oligosphaeraceae bacterium]
MQQLKIGLLPLYLQLYDEVKPEIRPTLEPFVDTIAGQFTQRQVEVLKAPVCCRQAEVTAALSSFTAAGVTAVVTLHLAYSPSLEAADALAASELPLLLLDTTPAYDFNFAPAGKTMANHGIHGVQDLANMLGRRKKEFLLYAGHWQHSDIFARALEGLQAAALVRNFRQSRVGLLGQPFAGMGDFFLPFADLERLLGIKVRQFPENFSAPLAAGELAAEETADRERFDFGIMDHAAYQRTLRASLRVRKWLEQEKLSAFSLCFRDITAAAGWETVPFLEASKALARGIGYAGEGDVLTAALVGALAKLHPETTFTEMFCPDWQNNMLYLSHMGEMNVNLVQGRPGLREAQYAFSATAAPAVAYGVYKPGPASIVNLAPLADERFRLLICKGVCFAPPDVAATAVMGWFKPARNLPEFLELYSRNFGTHHSALCYGINSRLLTIFAKLQGWDVVEI